MPARVQRIPGERSNASSEIGVLVAHVLMELVEKSERLTAVAVGRQRSCGTCTELRASNHGLQEQDDLVEQSRAAIGELLGDGARPCLALPRLALVLVLSIFERRLEPGHEPTTREVERVD